jgi:hypothetical protein
MPVMFCFAYNLCFQLPIKPLLNMSPRPCLRASVWGSIGCLLRVTLQPMMRLILLAVASLNFARIFLAYVDGLSSCLMEMIQIQRTCQQMSALRCREMVSLWTLFKLDTSITAYYTPFLWQRVCSVPCSVSESSAQIILRWLPVFSQNFAW